ncbi:diguanylate cyclase [Alkalimarinus coralli]|uniref:sensor domain-containing diguanylate cyclase n=1 Tax=Alkalimarinus coralli TaxID=2935863 RepID=UPI00202B2820|nr:diguanylate cyclase [Alkalimarinus coralli]
MILHWTKPIVAVLLVLFLSAMMFMILGSLSLRYQTDARPVAQAGSFNLTEFDLTEQAVSLDGEWNFFPGEYLSAFQVNERLMSENTHVIELPHSWDMSEFQTVQDSAHGFGTFHLKITIGDVANPLAIRLPTIGTAYSLFVNETHLTTVGLPGTNSSNTKPAYQPKVISFSPPAKTFDLTLRVANFSYNWGGVWYSIGLGSPEVIYDEQQHSLLLSVFLSGFLFAVAAFNLILCLLRRKEVLPLLVAMICTALGVRELILNDIILLHVFPALTFSQIIIVDYLTFYLSVPLFALFIRSSFPEQFSHTVMIAMGGVSAIYIGILLVASVDLSSRLIFSFQIYSIFIVMVYLFYVLGLAMRQRKQGAIALFIGTSALAITAVNDIAYAHEIGTVGYLTSFGVMIYVLSQLYVTNMRLTEAFSLSEKLGADLEASNKELVDLTAKLESTVSERTAELRASNQQLEAMAHTDALTGLVNRYGAEMVIKQEHERFKRSGIGYSVALIDLDHFKSINDRFGHSTGDEVLVKAALCLSSSVRHQDIVIRWGGEEFVVILPNTALKGAIVVLENIRQTIKSVVIVNAEEPFSMTATIGVAEVGEDETFSMCLSRADSLLYQGKAKGRDVVVY